MPEKSPKMVDENKIWKTKSPTNEIDILQVFNELNLKTMR